MSRLTVASKKPRRRKHFGKNLCCKEKNTSDILSPQNGIYSSIYYSEDRDLKKAIQMLNRKKVGV